MPGCSIKECSARKSKNRPNLSIHSVPKNEVRRRQWLDAIGQENINPRHKELFVCSLHFEESQLNRTLGLVRLREDAVPTLFNVHAISKPITVLAASGNIPEEDVVAMSNPQEHLPISYAVPSSSATSDTSFLQKTDNVTLKDHLAPTDLTSSANYVPQLCSSTSHRGSILQKQTLDLKKKPAKKNLRLTDQVRPEFNKIKKLQKICEEQKKKIKRLNEKVRRQGKKIGNLHDILKELKQKMIINNEQSLQLENCGGSQDFLKRQITKSKGLPLEKNIRKKLESLP